MHQIPGAVVVAREDVRDLVAHALALSVSKIWRQLSRLVWHTFQSFVAHAFSCPCRRVNGLAVLSLERRLLT